MGFLDRLKQAFGMGGASRGPAVDERAPQAPERTDPAVQSASASQTPEQQRAAAAADPAGTMEPGSEGQGQAPR
jgi:hypothetical protein